MDIEVRQAQRTMQRAGAMVLTDAATVEELPLQYGDLLLSWLKKQGLSHHVIRMLNTSQWEKAQALLQAEVHTEVRIQNQFQLRSSGTCAVQMRDADDAKLLAGYLANLSPLDIIRTLGISSRYAQESGGRAVQSCLFFFISPGTRDDLGVWLAHDAGLLPTVPSQTYVCVSASVYTYIVPAPEDLAKEAAQIEKDKQKKEAAAEKRRKTMETKEKTLLKKLQEKYANSEEES